MMKKLIRVSFLLAFIALSLNLTSCKKINEWIQPEPDNNTEEVFEGTIGLNKELIINENPLIKIYFTEYDVNVVNNGYKAEIVKAEGILWDLTSIRNAPTEGWLDFAMLEDKSGYIISYVHDGVAQYYRMWVTLNTSASGETVGVNYKFQKFIPHISSY